MWSVISHITSGLALAAFLAAIGLSAYRSSLNSRARLLQSLPLKSRPRAAEKELNAFGIKAESLTQEHQYQLALREIELRRSRLRYVTYVTVVVAIISGSIAAFAIYPSSSRLGERQKLDDTKPTKLISEYDFRLNELETRDEEIKQAANDDDKGALQVYIWRAVRGNSDFQPSLPEFANMHMVGVIVRLEEAGFTEHAKEAIQAARDLENGSAEAHSHQSPHGYGVFSQEYLDSRIKALRSYSDYIHRKVGS
jgi:hypothetical protein